MPADYGFVHPLWDFDADEGRLFERVTGEVGIEHVTVPVVSGAQTEQRFGCSPEAPHFHTDGGWHFRPATKAYAATSLRPHKARWFAGGDALARLRERAAVTKTRLVLRVDLRGVRVLVDQQRHLCQRNAWGQEVPFAGACPLNPDLRELLRATLEDLQRYEPAGVELVDWVPDTAVDRGPRRPFAWHPRVRQLLDVCFCASCRQAAARADLDADEAASAVRAAVQQALDTEEPSAAEGDPLVDRYLEVRRDDCRQWLQRLELRDTDARRLLLRSYDDPPTGNFAPWVPLVRLPNVELGPLNGDAWAARLAALSEMPALSLPVWRPAFGTSGDLVKLVTTAAQAGVSLFDFEGLSEAPAVAITWLKQAVRYARRT